MRSHPASVLFNADTVNAPVNARNTEHEMMNRIYHEGDVVSVHHGSVKQMAINCG